MKLGVMAVLFNNDRFEDMLAYFEKLGVEAIEIGCGGFPGNAHCKPDELLADEAKLKSFADTIKAHGLEISALSCHGNPVHPDKETAQRADKVFRSAVLLAEKLGVKTVITFSGCPGDCPTAKYPNWVTCAWPDDFVKISDYQWNEVLIPYWKEAAGFAKEHGVRVALEMHPGFCVYNTETMLRLRAAVGDTIGANFDPSHLFWQGIDPVRAIRTLGDAVFHFHAKDTKIDAYNTSENGVLDYKPYADEAHRSWIFRTVGYGHDAEVWRDIISALRLIGYEGALSIEHEDSLMTTREGLEKAVAFLKESIISAEKPKTIHWA